MARAQYTRGFYERRHARSRRAADAVIGVLVELGVDPGASVLDVGCGDGAWIDAFGDRGAARVVGIDGPWNAERFAERGDVEFRPAVLDELTPQEIDALVGDERFAVGVSVEVVEHLPPASGSAVVAALARSCDVVVFSGAVPGQGGVGHQNEGWPSQWAEVFAANGMVPFDVVRPVIWADPDIDFWYRQNVLVFARPGRFPGRRPADPAFLDLVHPEQLAHSRGTLTSAEALGVLRRRVAERGRRVARALLPWR